MYVQHCVTNADCLGGTCDTASGACTNTQPCATDADCGMGQACDPVTHTCAAQCFNGCPGNLFCDDFVKLCVTFCSP
jgi:hypothetical protein